MTNEITRENVQHILDRNAAEFKSKEAAMYEQERQLRLHINDNHATKTLTESQRAQKKAKEEQEARAAALAKRQQERAERAMEAETCITWYRFLIRVFTPILIAACTNLFASIGWLPIWLTIPVSIAGTTISITTLCLFLIAGFKNNH